MSDDLLGQDDIDALLSSVGGDIEDDVDTQDQDVGADSKVRPYDPRTQHRIIKERLPKLDMINQRFARMFRSSLFKLIRRNADITTTPVKFESYTRYCSNVPVPNNLNIVSMKPLKGNALFRFPPEMVFMVVDNLFGGDGSFVTRTEGREFTQTEQRIIQRLVNLAARAYEEAWESTFPIKVDYVRSESQTKFANITNSPSEVVVINTYNLDLGTMSVDFEVCIPFSMIEPLRELLSNPINQDGSISSEEWSTRMNKELRDTHVDLVAQFMEIPSQISQVLSLKIGDILPIELPKLIKAGVDGVPVLECGYGSSGNKRALSVHKFLESEGETSKNPMEILKQNTQ